MLLDARTTPPNPTHRGHRLRTMGNPVVVTETSHPTPDLDPSTIATEAALSEVGNPPMATSPAGSSLRMEQVAPHAKRQSAEATHPDTSGALAKLHRMAMTGPPTTRDERLARQAISNQLALSAELYNMLVFGETEDPTIASPSWPVGDHSRSR